jgi:hypothetical protein
MSTDKEEIAELKKEVADLKAKISPPPFDMERELREHRERMHRMSEERMSNASAFTRDDLRAMERACSTAEVQDLVRHSTVQSPSSISAPNQKPDPAPKVEPNRTGWSNPTPIGPPPGVNYADRLMDEQDRRDRAEDLERRRR